jgi:DNA adenine methylase
MSTVKSPPVRYPGGKWRIANWIISIFPPHMTYVEPFCGGASVFFRKPPSYHEVLNDLDGEIVNFFTVLREREDELMRALELTPFSREEYKASFEPSGDPLERARQFYILTRQGFGGYARRTGWRFQKNNNRGKKLIEEWNDLDWLYAAAGRLKDAMIEHCEAIDVIRRFDAPKTLFYVDPPYIGTSRGRLDHYRHEFRGDEEHVRLAECLQTVEGMVIVSGYPSELYQVLYKGWTVLETTTPTNGNGKSATECLWLSPRTVDVGALPLFS